MTMKKLVGVGISFIIIVIIIFNIVIRVKANQDKTYDDVVLETFVTRNTELGPSVYVDVVHEVTNLDMFVKSEPRALHGFYGYEQSSERYNHEYLEVMHASNMAGTDQRLMEGTFNIEIIYEKNTFEVTSVFGMILDYELINTVTINESLLNNEYVESNPCGSTINNMNNCIIFTMDLYQRFIQHEDYQLTTIDDSRHKQVIIPKVVGYRISYIAKINHLHLYPEPTEGPFGLVFEVEHGFFTNLGRRTLRKEFDF